MSTYWTYAHAGHEVRLPNAHVVCDDAENGKIYALFNLSIIDGAHTTARSLCAWLTIAANTVCLSNWLLPARGGFFRKNRLKRAGRIVRLDGVLKWASGRLFMSFFSKKRKGFPLKSLRIFCKEKMPLF